MLLCYQWTLYPANYITGALLYFPLITSIPGIYQIWQDSIIITILKITDIIKVGILLGIVNRILRYKEYLELFGPGSFVYPFIYTP